jgi:hypothetical protein
MSTTRKLQFHNFATPASTYVGEPGSLFFDPTTTTLRFGDGTTAGGHINAGANGPTGPTGPSGTGATGRTGPTGASFTTGTASATSGAVTLNFLAGTITDTINDTSSYNLTLTNSTLTSTSVIIFNVFDSAGNIWSITALSITNGGCGASFHSLSSPSSGTININYAIFWNLVSEGWVPRLFPSWMLHTA